MALSIGTPVLGDACMIQASIKTTFAPDKRVALFDIQFKTVNNKLLLEGETTSKKAFSVLLDSLHARKLTILNNVRFLPDSAVGDQ